MFFVVFCCCCFFRFFFVCFFLLLVYFAEAFQRVTIQEIRKKRIVAKANSGLEMINRHFSNLPEKVVIPLYNSLVKPIYCPSVWESFTHKNNINEIEKVQREATKITLGLHQCSYSVRLQKMKLDSIVFRRRRSDIIKFVKSSQKY